MTVVKATSHKLSQQVVGNRALISRFAQEIVRSRSVFFTSFLFSLLRWFDGGVDVTASPIEQFGISAGGWT